MKHRKLLPHTLGLILITLLLIGCGTTTTTPTPVPPKASATLASTPVVTPSQPAATSIVEATIPVNLSQPIVLMDDQIKLTVSTIGHVVGEGAYIQPAHQSTQHLLQLTVSVENLTNQQLWFGPDPNSLEEEGQAQTNYKLLEQAAGVQSTRFVSLKDATASVLKVGGVEGPGQNSWGYGAFAVQPGSTIQVAVAFVVPNQATQLTAALITASIT